MNANGSKSLLKIKTIGLARKFKNTFRFIDDLITVNDSGEFEKLFIEIYPPMLTLKKENLSNLCAKFLDLHISTLLHLINATLN